MNTTTNKSAVTLLFHPFVYIAGGKALGLGLAAILLAALIGSLGNTHFDGVLDVHTGAAAPLWVFVSEGLINWLCLSAVLLGIGRIISQTSFRTIDVLGTQALARWPTVLISLVLLPKAVQRFANDLVEQFRQGRLLAFNPADAIIFFAAIAAMIPLLCWMVYLMYHAFSISCNVKGGKAIGMFIVGLILAEILSKVLLMLVLSAGNVNINPPSVGRSVAPSGEATGDFTASGAEFVDLLVKEDFAAAVGQFDATMKSAMPEKKLQEVWQDLLRNAGPFQKQLRTRLENQMGYKVVFVTCQFEKSKLDMKVVFNSQKQVAGLFYVPSSEP